MNHSRAPFWIAAVSLALAALFAGCGSDSTPGDPGNTDGGVSIVVDTKIDVPIAGLPVADGDDPRPVAAVVGEHGHQAEFVENELWIKPAGQAELDAFLLRWKGALIDEFDPAAVGLGGDPKHYLVRVKTAGADTSELTTLMSELSGVETASLRVSSNAALELLAASAVEAGAGLEVGINWVGRGAGFIDSTTDEAPTGDPRDYTPDAFEWASHAAGNTQDIGVAEAWRMLELAGKLDNRVKIAILDMGFSAINDYPDELTVISNVPFVGSPMETANLLGCGGGPCPWHGNMVTSTAMATTDDSYGAAGPAGPIGDAILVFTLYDFFTSIGAVGAAYAAGADIANMSYSAPIPGILSWTALPFELATLGFREAGMLIFAAAGNAGANVDDESCFGFCWENTLHTPCENGGVICVGGLAYDSRNRASGSNFGGGSVDIFAPYTCLVGPDPDNPANHARMVNGTSFSSPFTAGVAALIWAADPGLSADEVEDILFSTAHTSEDSRVGRYVNAAAAVRAALGDAAPFVTITSPVDGSSFARGSVSVSFRAVAEDVEDGTPTVTWTSSRDGEIGTGTFFSRTDLSSGVHVITATARDSFGNVTTDQVSITITNTAPDLTIDSPASGATFFESQTISFQGSSFDLNELAPLPDSAVRWTLGGVLLGGGHSVSQPGSALGIGTHTVVFSGSDGDLSGQDQIQISVQADPVNVPPSVAIWAPANGAELWVDTFDPAQSAWYLDVAFSGVATDPEDGSLNGTDVVWTARRSGAPDETLGTGRGMTARLYSRDPFATQYTIILSATDSGGEMSSTSIKVAVKILARPGR